MRIDKVLTQRYAMHLYIQKNIQFTKHFKANGQVKEFNFRKITGHPEELFHVDVNDDRGNRIVFRMQKTSDQHWRIVQQQLPNWIWEVENKIHEVIEEELNSEPEHY